MTKKVSPGDAIAFPADHFNVTVDMADAYKKQKFGQAPQEQLQQAKPVRIRNETDSTIRRFGCVRVLGVLVDAEANEQEFRNNWVLKGDSMNGAPTDPIAVAQQDIPHNAIGPCVIDGLTPAYVNIQEAHHGYVQPIDSNRMKSAIIGPARFVFPVQNLSSSTSASDDILTLIRLAPAEWMGESVGVSSFDRRTNNPNIFRAKIKTGQTLTPTNGATALVQRPVGNSAYVDTTEEITVIPFDGRVFALAGEVVTVTYSPNGHYETIGEQGLRRKGKTDSAITAGSSGPVSIWNAADTGTNVTAWLDWMHGSEDISAGKEVRVEYSPAESKWAITGADCE